MLQTESKALSNRITTLEADNAKLSAENMQVSIVFIYNLIESNLIVRLQS